ncbi:MAG: sigma-54 interaction domain-containing protein [Thermodesulfobacteriota bacterium]
MHQFAPSPDDTGVQTLINGIPHGIAMVDESGIVFGINHFLEALTGYGSHMVKGHAVDQVIRSNLSLGPTFFQKAHRDGDRVSREGDIINVNRKKVPVRVTISPLHGVPEIDNGFLLVIEDISLLGDPGSGQEGVSGSTGLIGCSSAMQDLFDLLPILAHSDTTLLITGETGTGKDLFAETIHKASKRAKSPFIKVNCGALPEALLESELFGHVRGAFTGAHAEKQGMFRLAQGGTIFLTEIGDLPLPLQVKLLTVLDDREFFPVGGSKKIKVDVRIITGTHRDLPQLIREGRFREDLYFRLNVLRAHMPALRERDDDVKLLLEFFLRQLCKNLDKKIAGFDRETETLLHHYHYPGNVRELRNIIEYAVNLCQGQTIQTSHLPGYLLESMKPRPENETKKETTRPPEGVSIHNEERGDGISTKRSSRKTEAVSWSEFEKRKIFETLVKTSGNRTQAAKMLGWWRSKLLRKIKLYGLE